MHHNENYRCTKRLFNQIKFFLRHNIRENAHYNIECSVNSIKEWCTQYFQSYYSVKDATELAIPAFLISHKENENNFNRIFTIPEIYLAEIHDATIFGGHTPILVGKNVVLYDEYISLDKNLYDFDLEGNFITFNLHNSKNPINVRLPRHKGERKVAGILVAGRWSYNYYHWLIDYLSRFWVIEQFPEYSDLPLIIDEGLHPNLIEALEMINPRKRPLIKISYGESLRVKKLIFPSSLTLLHPNPKPGVTLTWNFADIINPIAITYLREKFDVEERVKKCETTNRIYISRKYGNYRRLINEEEIEQLFIQYGFSAVNPADLSFHEQLELFATADIIGGPAGAGFTNIIFAPPTARIIQIGGTEYVWPQIANIIGQILFYIPGEPIAGTCSLYFQCDYRVNVQEVERVIRKFTSD